MKKVVINMVTSRGGRDLMKPYGPSAVKLPNKEFQLLMEDARVLFLNFTGRPGTFNQAGDRNFCVILDPEVAEDMRADGWNVKQLKPRDDEEGDYYISVQVKYRNRFGEPVRPPKLKIISSQGAVLLGEDEAELLDQVDVAKVDLIINGRTRIDEVDGKRKISAYLQSYFVTVNEDYLEMKYADVEPAENNFAIEASQTPSWSTGSSEVVEGELVD